MKLRMAAIYMREEERTKNSRQSIIFVRVHCKVHWKYEEKKITCDFFSLSLSFSVVFSFLCATYDRTQAWILGNRRWWYAKNPLRMIQMNFEHRILCDYTKRISYSFFDIRDGLDYYINSQLFLIHFGAKFNGKCSISIPGYVSVQFQSIGEKPCHLPIAPTL